MSVVYEVQHTKLARAFALKRLQPTLIRNTEAIQRFSLEAELLASLRHPNVVDISDWLTLPDDSPCMILEFLHGASLGRRLQREALPWETIARMGDQAMSALQLAHRMGIVHRDLKPDNIFISIDDVGEERVKLVDFGVSKLSGTTRLSGAHEIVGTPSYMSPEQAQGIDEVGPATDVWAMGTILYEMATQKIAFDAKTVAEALMRIVSGQAEPLLAHRKDAPPAFVELVERAIARDSRRIETIEELRAGLRKALAAPPKPSRSTGRLATPAGGVPTLAPPLATSRTTTGTAQSPPLTLATGPRKALVPASESPASAFRAEGTAVDDSKRKLVTYGIVAAVVVTLLNVVIAIAL